MPAREISIVRAGAGDVDRLRPLYLALQRYHGSVTSLPLVAGDTAWEARRAAYLGWFGEERAMLFLASADGELVGYAFVVLHDGADDTFPLAPRYAEVYSLVVAEGARGGGIGGLLLDAVDDALVGEGDPPLVLSVMAGNADALRFYERRGLVPGEIVLYRLPAAGED